jgi:hypothetical protein
VNLPFLASFAPEYLEDDIAFDGLEYEEAEDLKDELSSDKIPSSDGKNQDNGIKIRKSFPESWIFDSFTNVSVG